MFPEVGKESAMDPDAKEKPKDVFILYRFVFPGGKMREFPVRLDGATLGLSGSGKRDLPEWTRLPFARCPNCRLSGNDFSHCPVAVNLVDVIDFFKPELSFEEVDIEIETRERKYVKRAPLHYGLSSLMGIYMVTSGCPVLDRLRPMVKTHLPFATMEETLYRAISMYLVAQYFLLKRGRSPDWEMKNLVDIYLDVGIVNEHFWKRISAVQIQDAAVNAVTHLDCFARFTNLSLMEKGLGEIERLFHAYYE